MKISDLSSQCGLSIDTLRYYEKIGLIAPPWRDGGGRRDYPESTLGWIAFLKALKATGMPLSEMQTYARLRAEGEHTSAERREMLEEQRRIVGERIAELQACEELLHFKIANYAEIEARHRGTARPRRHKA